MDITSKIFNSINNLPTLPTVYTTISEAMEDPNINSDKIAKIISTDQVSSFKILKVANSPFYGFHGKMDTISKAILYLGFNEVKNIIFALSVINFFSKDKLFARFSPLDFWAHSIGVGIATRLIGSESKEKNLENYFLAGIFHDIGKLLFFEFARKEYTDVLEVVESKKCRIKDAELEVLGVDHAKIGQLLAEKWKLPQIIQHAILYHHIGTVAGIPDKLVGSVHIGNILARILEMGFGGDNIIPEPNTNVWEILSLSNHFFTNSRKSLKNDFEQTVRLMLVE